MAVELGRIGVTETNLGKQAKLPRVRPSSMAAAGAATLLTPGDLLGQRYQVEEHLSQGGMGVVYRGRDLVSGDPVAIKVLRADRQQESLLTRFRHEYYLMATLSHPRFVEVRDLVIAAQGMPCLVMEFVEGEDLDRVVPLNPAEAIEVIDQLCEALAFLHSRRYVHHDLKSNNVRIDRDASGKVSVRILDFGIMEPIGSVRRELAGTPAYLPPEVLFGAPTDPRLDLYSLGTLAFEIYAGYVPFDIRDAESFVQAKQVSPPDVRKLLVDAPPEMAELVSDLMSPEVAARPQDASVVRRRLRQCAPALGTATGLEAPTYLKPSRLLGRDRELAQLTSLWESSALRPALGCIRGQAGLGKTALLRELALRMRRGGGLAELVSTDASAGAYSLIRPLLRALWQQEAREEPTLLRLAPQVMRILPEVGRWFDGVKPVTPHSDAVEDRRQLFAALCEWVQVARSGRSVALLVDNAHRADNASLEALRALHAEAGPGICLVLTVRPDATSRDVALSRLLGGAELDLAVGRLDQPAVSALLSSLFGAIEPYPRLCAELTSAAQGNPALVLELVRELVGAGVIQFSDERWQLPRALGDFPVPTSLAEALMKRLKQASGTAQGVIDVLTVAGRALDLDLIAACSEGSDSAIFAALDELRDADLVSESGDGYDLAPGLSRRRLLEDISSARQTRLHGLLGRLLERRYGDHAKAHAAELAVHFLRGGAKYKAIRYLDWASSELYQAQALADARPLLDELESLLVAEGGEDARYGSALHSQLLVTRQRLARVGVAIDSDLGDRMLGLERQMYLPAVRSLPSGASIGRRVGEFGRVVGGGVLRGKLAPASVFERLVQYFTATSYQTVLLSMKGDFKRADEVAHTLLPFILGERDHARGAYAACRCISLTHQGYVARAERFGKLADVAFHDPRLTSRVSPEDVETGLGGVYTLMCLLYAERGAPQCAEWLGRLDDFVGTRERERAWLMPNYLLTRLQYHLHRGEVLRCREVEAEYKAVHARSGGFNAQVETKIMISLARAAVAARDLVGAEALCGELSAFPPDQWVAHGWGSAVLAEVWRQQRLYPRAAASLEEALANALRPGSRSFKLEMRVRNTQAALALDVADYDAARRHAQAVLEIACEQQTRNEYEELWARRVLVFIAHEAGEPANAKRQLSALAHLVNSTKNPLFEAVYEKLVSDGVGVSSEVLVAEHRAAAERLFQRLGFAPETLGGSRRGTTGPGADSGAWWNQTTDPGYATSDQETVVAMPESALLIEDIAKHNAAKKKS
ncbi:MAG: protein kinase [Polyangiaceae bacterium]|nr:protein kinase [Myxococcales bacterium]MCB9591048.1 protein kinase [Polyangiaceae bacterium]MCB9610367.1 protein kinase [Polyangiaceae bacterium]